MTPDEEKRLQQRDREKKLKELANSIKEDSQAYSRIVNQLVNEYADDLDEFINDLDRIIRDIKKGRIKQYSELKLEMKCLMLSHAMYKAADGLAELGGQADIAKIQREDAFNRAYQLTKEGTIPDKKSEAEERIVIEKTMEKVMQRAYNALSVKIKSGNRILEAIKKILTSRMIHKEVFRKEAPVMDDIDPEEIMDNEQVEEFEDGDI